MLEQTGTVIPALRLAIASDVPIGAGLSSSAALEVATIRALFRLFGRAEDPAEIAHLAWQAEVQHAGVSCGVLDQMAVSFGAPHRMLFLDTATEEHRLLPLPPGSEILVVDSGIRRKLSGSAYNLRREECRQAAASLGADTLSAPGLDLRLVESRLLPPLLGRARHVISENARVNAALSASAEAFGRLMNESHASLRDDFEVSLPALDRLAESLQSEPEVFGAKLTGAGFGGACVALVPTGRAQAVGRRVCARQPPDSGSHWQVVVPPLCPAGGPMVS